MISIPTTLATAKAIAEANPHADVVHTADSFKVYPGAVVFVADIPDHTWTAFPHGYLSRRSA